MLALLTVVLFAVAVTDSEAQVLTSEDFTIIHELANAFPLDFDAGWNTTTDQNFVCNTSASLLFTFDCSVSRVIVYPASTINETGLKLISRLSVSQIIFFNGGSISRIPNLNETGNASLRHLEVRTPNTIVGIDPQDLSAVVLLYIENAQLGSSLGSVNLLEITSLQLPNCSITSIPASWSSLVSVTTLDLSNNAISDISTLFSMVALDTLTLSNNRITSIRDYFESLQNLRTLKLDGNPLQALPPSIGLLYFAELDLSNNNYLQTWPDTLTYMAYKGKIFLQNCGIFDFPPNFAFEIDFGTLDVTNCVNLKNMPTIVVDFLFANNTSITCLNRATVYTQCTIEYNANNSTCKTCGGEIACGKSSGYVDPPCCTSVTCPLVFRAYDQIYPCEQPVINNKLPSVQSHCSNGFQNASKNNCTFLPVESDGTEIASCTASFDSACGYQAFNYTFNVTVKYIPVPKELPALSVGCNITDLSSIRPFPGRGPQPYFTMACYSEAVFGNGDLCAVSTLCEENFTATLLPTFTNTSCPRAVNRTWYIYHYDRSYTRSQIINFFDQLPNDTLIIPQTNFSCTENYSDSRAVPPFNCPSDGTYTVQDTLISQFSTSDCEGLLQRKYFVNTTCSNVTTTYNVNFTLYNPCYTSGGKQCVNGLCVSRRLSPSFCQCNQGYEKNNNNSDICVDVDECQGTNVCNSNAVCVNSDGSYSCVCKPGYYGNGFTDCKILPNITSSSGGYVVPILDCVDATSGSQVIAYIGYFSGYSTQHSISSPNYFINTKNAKPPTSFSPGLHSFSSRILLSGSSDTWILGNFRLPISSAPLFQCKSKLEVRFLLLSVNPPNDIDLKNFSNGVGKFLGISLNRLNATYDPVILTKRAGDGTILGEIILSIDDSDNPTTTGISGASEASAAECVYNLTQITESELSQLGIDNLGKSAGFQMYRGSTLVQVDAQGFPGSVETPNSSIRVVFNGFLLVFALLCVVLFSN